MYSLLQSFGQRSRLVGGFNPDLKNISQNGNLPQIGVKIKNIWNHHLAQDLALSLRVYRDSLGSIWGPKMTYQTRNLTCFLVSWTIIYWGKTLCHLVVERNFPYYRKDKDKVEALWRVLFDFFWVISGYGVVDRNRRLQPFASVKWLKIVMVC